jgi:aminoglycoside 6'-N-acetyltransferase
MGLYARAMVELRPMQDADVALIERWDRDPVVRAALGGAAMDWWDWEAELGRDLPWRELLIAENDGRPFGFVQLTDAHDEETHYWGDVDPGTWALDIWLGSGADRGRGLGRRVMDAATDRCFGRGATTILIDPLVTNTQAIGFYLRYGFETVGERDFDGDRCLVMRLDRVPTSS